MLLLLFSSVLFLDLFTLSVFGLPRTCMSAQKDLVRSALKGLFVFDAVASPSHWFYDRNALKATYGEIKGYVKPTEKMRGSIMSLSNTGGGGRGSNKGDIVGGVILHDKKKYWQNDFHYHVTLEKGENTLEGSLTRLMVRTLSASKVGGSVDEDLDAFRTQYISFMTTPGTHNDSYASTCHRMFFANMVSGKDPRECPDDDGHNVDSMDALTLTVPVILQAWARGASKDEISKAALQAIRVTRRVSSAFVPYCNEFCQLYTAVLDGSTVQEAVEASSMRLMGASMRQMVERGGDDPMVACYIDSSFPALLFFLYKYADAPMSTAALANANAGGENVARGSVLGAVLGARRGDIGAVTGWCQDGLLHGTDIDTEIDAFVSTF
jgi:hypothetical protein